MRSIAHFFRLLSIACLLHGCHKDKHHDQGAPTDLDINNLVETSPANVGLVPDPTGGILAGYLKALPFNYLRTNKKYPLLISLHGGGQFGDGSYQKLSLLFQSGIPRLMAENRLPPSFNVNGKSFSFIILAPQFRSYPSNEDVGSFLELAKENFRVDTGRIYITGLSMGGIVASDLASEIGNKLAAIIPIAGVSGNFGSTVSDKCLKLATEKLPIWVFHNRYDPNVNSSGPQNFVNEINKYDPAISVKLTLFPDSTHDAWTKACDPVYKENQKNIYEWMLQYHRF